MIFIVAVHALVYLSHRGCLASSEELAENICTNPARVRKIMGKLKKMGIITTREGHVGGYCPCEGLEKVSLYEIAQGMDTVFVDTKWRSGNEENNCFISSGMSSVFDSLYRELDRLCMDHLKGITLGDVTAQIVEPSAAAGRNATEPSAGTARPGRRPWKRKNPGKRTDRHLLPRSVL